MSTNPSTFLSGPNAPFIEELYARYLDQPDSVDPSWRKFFSDLEDETEIVLNDIRGASWSPRERAVEIAREDGNGHYEEAAPVSAAARPQDLKRAARDSLRTMMLIRAYRVRGHLEASLDPLDLKPRAKHADLDPRTLGFTEADMDRPIFLDGVLGLQTGTLREVLDILKRTYKVDANIGGETAVAVGEKMRQIGAQRQVLCITHLAQVAAAAESHFVVAKEIIDGRTISSIRPLDPKSRVAELTRMLGGGDAARKHAEAMLKRGK